jgi:hypothetical protein
LFLQHKNRLIYSAIAEEALATITQSIGMDKTPDHVPRAAPKTSVYPRQRSALI